MVGSYSQWLDIETLEIEDFQNKRAIAICFGCKYFDSEINNDWETGDVEYTAFCSAKDKEGEDLYDDGINDNFQYGSVRIKKIDKVSIEWGDKMNIAVIDCNAICYMAHYTTSQMNRSDGTPVGIIWGFFNQLKTIVEQTECAHLVFAWDSQESKRKELFPQYKEGRAAKREEDPTIYDSFFQFDELYNDILPRLGFVNNFKFNGFEGDDIMAKVCDQYAGEHYITLVSNDQDLYQLLGRTVRMYKPSKGILYTSTDFRNEFDSLCPVKWVYVKAIGGCAGDGVPGIYGVGVKTCVKYLLENKGTKKIDTEEGKAIMKRNWPLVCLPFEGTPEVELQWPKMDYQLWKEFCIEYEFDSMLKQSDFWRALFNYDPPPGYYPTPSKYPYPGRGKYRG